VLAGMRGRPAQALPLIEAAVRDATEGGQGTAVQYAWWAAAVLGNGLGRPDQALAAAQRAGDDTPGLFVSTWSLIELVEAAVGCGRSDLARDALDRVTEATEAAGTDWALGMLARSRALLGEGQAADDLHREAVQRLARTRLRPELARAHLLYGEWLHREGRRVEARGQLRAAWDLFVDIRMEAFADRAGRALAAVGERVSRPGVDPVDALTAHEAEIAQLAAAGHSNPDIGAQLFLSPRTVEWHLRKVFSKLGVSTRRDLAGVLGREPVDAAGGRSP
jgi:DNA-binding CsgD family transcriptional regulator